MTKIWPFFQNHTPSGFLLEEVFVFHQEQRRFRRGSSSVAGRMLNVLAVAERHPNGRAEKAAPTFGRRISMRREWEDNVSRETLLFLQKPLFAPFNLEILAQQNAKHLPSNELKAILLPESAEPALLVSNVSAKHSPFQNSRTFASEGFFYIFGFECWISEKCSFISHIY